MRRRLDPKALRGIAAIRDHKLRAAEGEVARASASVKGQERICEEKEREHSTAEQAWLGTIRSQPLDTDMMRLWSNEVCTREYRVREAAVELASDRTALKARREDWHEAEMMSDVAHDLLCRSLKEVARRREEHTLQNATDLHAYRRWMS